MAQPARRRRRRRLRRARARPRARPYGRPAALVVESYTRLSQTPPYCPNASDTAGRRTAASRRT
jgi:hypothetical protein